MKINLIGAVGGGNFGDEFILNSCMTEYSKMNRATIFVSGFNDGLILKNNCAVITEETNFFQVMMDLKKETLDGRSLSMEQITAGFESLEKFDLIHFIGGGISIHFGRVIMHCWRLLIYIQGCMKYQSMPLDWGCTHL